MRTLKLRKQCPRRSLTLRPPPTPGSLENPCDITVEFVEPESKGVEKTLVVHYSLDKFSRNK